MYLPYILESNPHPFYSFRGIKKSDADQNRVRIRFRGRELGEKK